MKRLIVSPQSELIPHASTEAHVQRTPHHVFGGTENPVTIFWLQPFGFENLDGFIYGLWLVRDGADGEQHNGEYGDSRFRVSR